MARVLITAVFIIVMFGLVHVVRADEDDDDDDMSPVGAPPAPMKVKPAARGVSCNETNYTNVSPTDSYVRHVLGQLGEEVSRTKDYAKVINFPEIDTPIMSGQGTCKKNVTKTACTKCLKEGAKKVLDSCPQRVGAQFNATACQLRYDVY